MRKSFISLSDFPNICSIDKGANFRSAPAIVNVLNRLRPELKQEVDDHDEHGVASLFHCNSFPGQRLKSLHSKNDLPQEYLSISLNKLTNKLRDEGWDFSPNKTKILMLTHNSIAAQQGYPTLAKIFDRKEAFAKKEDSVIAFLSDIVEPVCKAYRVRNYGEMFRIIGSNPTIKNHSDKAKWRRDMDILISICAHGTIGNVIDHLKETKRPQINDKISKMEELLFLSLDDINDETLKRTDRYKALRDVSYKEFLKLSDFIDGSTPFATKHSVKGAEYENVLVVLSGGWNHYNWPKFLESLEKESISAADQNAFHRARNLFYVAISRPKKRLAVLATQTLSDKAISAAQKLFGASETHAFSAETWK